MLVDDEVAASDWEQELYRMGVPPEMSVHFHSVDDAAAMSLSREAFDLLSRDDLGSAAWFVEARALVELMQVGGRRV